MPTTTTAPGVKGLPEVEGLFAPTGDGDGVRLCVGRCAECGAVFFPSHAQLHVPNCSGGPVEEGLMAPTGTLVSYTIQHYTPPDPYPTPTDWEPVGIGTVVFAEQGLQVPGQLTGIDLDDLRVGITVETAAATLYVDEDGVERQTYKFRPVPPAGSTGSTGSNETGAA